MCWRIKYLKGLEILGHDISKLGKRVLLGLLILSQGLPHTSPQDDHDLQQMGHDRHVFAQQRFSLLRHLDPRIELNLCLSSCNGLH